LEEAHFLDIHQLYFQEDSKKLKIKITLQK
jgi:hypothetical protein